MKYIKRCLLSLLALTVLCSCGVGKEGNQTTEAAAEMATGSAVSAVFKNSKTTEKKEWLKNDFIQVFCYVNDDGDKEWAQENLDGTDRRQVDIEGLTSVDGYDVEIGDILWLTDDWIYLALLGEKDAQYEFCRIPLLREEELIYDSGNREDLFRLDLENDGDGNTIMDFIVTDAYILYRYRAFAGDSHETEYYCYDFSTKETSLAFSTDKECAIKWTDNLPLTLNNGFLLQAGNSIYSVDCDTFKKTKISPDPEELMEEGKIPESDVLYDSYSMAVYDECLYFAMNTAKIFRYDGNSVECVADLYDIVQDSEDDINPITDDGIAYISEIYAWNGRLYLYTYIDENYGFLLSSDFMDLKQWEKEDGFMGFVTKADHDDMTFFCNGKIYFSTKKDGLVAYDIETGKVDNVVDDDEFFVRVS